MEPGQSSLMVIQLKHMELSPEVLVVTEPVQILLKVSTNNSSLYSSSSEREMRKFIFLMEETDEETPPLAEGQEHLFLEPLTQVGSYHLQCINYSKIKSVVELSKKQLSVEEEVVQPLLPSSPAERQNMQNILEVQEQKEQETREGLQQSMSHSPSRSSYAEYQKILSDKDIHYDSLPNKYLKYFKEEFKLWNDFFQSEPEQPTKDKEKENDKQKEKYGSQGQGQEKLSSSSLSFSEKEQEKEALVVGRLRSHQQISDSNEEELSHPKTMKKTNSEYCFTIEREVDKTHLSSNSKKRPLYTNQSSPHQQTEHSQAETFMDWACSWPYEQGLDQIVIKKQGDRHLARQWFTYLQNKFKISKFMYG